MYIYRLKRALMPELLLCCFFVFTLQAETLKTVITVDRDVYQDTQRFLAGRSVYEVTNFSTEFARRDVIDFVLIQQAIALGGIKLQLRYETGNYDARNIRSISSGILLLGLDSFWLSELEAVRQHIYISEPLIRRGEYIVGIYTSPSNSKALAVTHLAQLKALTAVSSSHWRADWQTWQHIAPARLTDEKSWPAQARMVSKAWVDVMLAPFLPQLPFRISTDNYQLVAIPGIKVALYDSRHVAVARNHPDGERVFAALQAGLTQLRAEGRIIKAYTDAGFFHPQVADWTLLNPLSDQTRH